MIFDDRIGNNAGTPTRADAMRSNGDADGTGGRCLRFRSAMASAFAILSAFAITAALLISSVAAALPSGQPATQVVSALARFDSVARDDPAAPPPFILEGTIEPFDTSLGTLVDARFTTSFGMSGSATAELDFPVAGSHGATLVVEAEFLGPNGIVIDTYGSTLGAMGVNVITPGLHTLSDGNSTNWRYPEISQNLDLFLSPNTFSFVVDYIFKFIGGPSFPERFDLQADEYRGIIHGPGSIEYEYIPIPEPSTALFLALGLLGLGHKRGRE